MKRWLVAIGLCLLVAGIGVGFEASRGDSTRAAGRTGPGRFHYISMESAKESAFREAAEWYGLPAPDAYSRDEDEGARCPSHVPARKGQIFWCQALLKGNLVPVEMELSSPLGFFNVVKVGESSALRERIEQEEAEQRWCWRHPSSPAC